MASSSSEFVVYIKTGYKPDFLQAIEIRVSPGQTIDVEELVKKVREETKAEKAGQQPKQKPRQKQKQRQQPMYQQQPMQPKRR